MRTGYKQVKFRISNLQHQRLKAAARNRGCSMAEIMRLAAVRFCNDYEDCKKCI